DICYIGDEVRDPARVIPRSILFSILGCAVGYFLLHLSLLGVMPWREMLNSKFVVSEFMERLHGRGAAVAVTVMILWTAFGSVFAFVGWSYIFVTSGWGYVAVGLLTLAAGVGAFLVKARLERAWPFLAASLLVLSVAAGAAAADRLDLRSGWTIQSSAKVAAKG